MINFIYQVVRTARPRQWLKNMALFAPALILGDINEISIISKLLSGLLAFCLISSAAYLINDIVDAKKDALHPIKKNRPIPSGKLSAKAAWAVAFLLLIVGFWYSKNYNGTFFTYILATYMIIQFLYSFVLRNIIIIDSLTVASGFVLRVIAGGVITNISISSWLILTTIGLSLLLAFGKRRSEKTILSDAKSEAETRKTLKSYPDTLLDAMITMSATFTVVTYSFFTFQVSPDTGLTNIRKFLPSIIESPKWLMITIPLIIYGIARYLYVIYEKKGGESPERVLLSDKPLLASVIIWIAFVYLVNNIF